ncbi:hypothetical protein ACJRO7_022961 [Eucalyptus globulus]|uniref:Uncharacterized protein n=1 Tax=Eucalyptus globulus TaxID=34317 RepID=A0ABD3K4N4_EUCGL
MASRQPISAASPLPLHALLSIQPAVSSRGHTPSTAEAAVLAHPQRPSQSRGLVAHLRRRGFNPPTALWPGKELCFHENTAWLEFHNETGSEFGGGTLHIKVSKAHSWTCMDIYILATPYHLTWDYYFLSREHTFEFKSGEEKLRVSIFLMQARMLGTFQALWDVFPLFSNTGWGEKSNIDFLKKHMGASFEQCPQPWVTNISIDDIHSGDFLAISKIRGRWGGFETREMGQWCICWSHSWLNKDDSNPHIALLPLHPDMRAKFNETAAWKYAQSMNGKPYGYHNMLFSWIDTIDANYPPPLDAHVVASVMTVWNQMQPAYAANMWNEALNKRLGTELPSHSICNSLCDIMHLGLDLLDLMVETEMRGSSFAELLTIPKQDDWVYSDGKSTSCVVFVLERDKAAGLFDPISSSIQVTEFTIKDAYSLRFFENNSSCLPKWCDDGDDVELLFCQIRGRYRMELLGYIIVDPYPHMNEMCPSLPPKYSRPSDC